MSNNEEGFALLNKVRDLGFAVAAFTPEELCGAEPRRVEDQMVEAGWETVSILATEPFPPGHALAPVKEESK